MSEASLETEICDLEREWMEAWRRTPRQQWLENARGVRRLAPEVVLVHGRGKQRAGVASQNWSGVFLSDGWVKRPGGWQVVARVTAPGRCRAPVHRQSRKASFTESFAS